MGSKNPFLKSGKRKKRSKRSTMQPGDENFCPRLMIRYDQGEDSPIGYKTLWVCKMCTTCVLNEYAVLDHLTRCKEEFKRTTTVYEPVKSDESEDSRYICRLCNRYFSRKVTLIKHIEKHEKNSDSELNDSESEFVVPRKRRKQIASTSTSLKNHNEIASATSTTSVNHQENVASSVQNHIDERESTSGLELCESNNVFEVLTLPPSISSEGHYQSESTTPSSLDVNTQEVSELKDNDENTVEF